ncbi:MAG: alcohol dehydrogenase catalytic domain-containing protein [Polyangia bacterium]
MSTYRAVQLVGPGGFDRIQVVSLPLEAPGAGELRIKVEAAGAGATDLLMRRQKYMFAPPWPFTLGYEVVGRVDAVGEGATGFSVGQRVCAVTVHGAMAEYLVRSAEDFVAVPDGLDAGDVAALPLNYGTAYQMIHRVAKMQPGQTALVTGANGGVGTALLELLRLHGVKAVGAADPKHFRLIEELGGVPIEARGKPLPELVREKFPGGVDASFDILGGAGTRQCIRATRRGGSVVGYGFMATTRNGKSSTLAVLRGFAALYLGAPLAGRRGAFYGITARFRKDRRPLKEDLATLIALYAEGKLKPRIAHRLSLLEGRRSQELLEAGGVAGKIVLVAG